jgi:SAM-dependent methyltransferase
LRKKASSPENIYWSVIADRRFKSLKDGELKEQFFKSGEDDFNRIWAIVEKYSKPLFELDVLDYGAGVGRVSRAFLPRVKNLTCADFSAPHLDECQKNLAQYSENKFHIELLESWMDIESLQKFDLIYSLITLQHNTPPIIEMTLKSLLEKLKDGGVALLHIPLTTNSYTFDPQKYLNSSLAGTEMEMHILPKANIYKVADEAGCQICYSACFGGTNITYSEWFVFRKL